MFRSNFTDKDAFPFDQNHHDFMSSSDFTATSCKTNKDFSLTIKVCLKSISFILTLLCGWRIAFIEYFIDASEELDPLYAAEEGQLFGIITLKGNAYCPGKIALFLNT